MATSNDRCLLPVQMKDRGQEANEEARINIGVPYNCGNPLLKIELHTIFGALLRYKMGLW